MSDPIVICPYCLFPARLMNGYEVAPCFTDIMFYKCDPCDAWTGTHKDSGDPPRPLGRLAKRELHNERRATEAEFAKVIKIFMAKHSITEWDHGRRKAYKWLAETMDVDRSQCQIGDMDEAGCQNVAQLCREFVGGQS